VEVLNPGVDYVGGVEFFNIHGGLVKVIPPEDIRLIAILSIPHLLLCLKHFVPF
jgi:hypothetical protein